MAANIIDFWSCFITQQTQKLNIPNYAPSILTFEGISPKVIQVVEQQYGVKLPESYKSFLAASNGLEIYFDDINNPDFRIFPIEEICLFLDFTGELFNDLDSSQNKEWNWGLFPFSNDNYNTFYNKEGIKVDINGIPKRDPLEELPVRLEYLQDLLVIGVNNDQDIIVCLNPNIQTVNCELEVWYIEYHYEPTPFSSRFLSFVDMMEYIFSRPSKWVVVPPSEALGGSYL